MNEDWLDLLPIESLESLLEGVAAKWRIAVVADRVEIECLSIERTRLVTGWSDAAASGSETRDLPTSTELDALPRGDADWSRVLQPVGEPLARVIMHGGGCDDSVSVWEAMSERLIGQALHLDRLQNEALAGKLESMAEFAAGAGHEINNPLATINGRVQLLLKGETDPERRRSLEVIGGQAHRVRDMIGDAMLFGRPPEPQLADVDGAAVIRRVCETFGEDAPEGVKWSVEGPDELILRADESQFAIVVGELLRNSLHAVGESGTVAVRTADGRTGSPSYGRAHALVTIADDGPGLTDLDRRHLFDPFFSARQAGRGLGFGLSKAWRIVRLHGGTIDVESEPGRTTFSVRWPLA